MACPPDRRLTPNQIAGYAQAAGFNKADSIIMTAIALAESGGCPSSHNGDASTGDDSYGLWQINYFGSLAGSRTAAYGPPAGMFDPAKNAAAARSMFQSSGFRPWSTYTNGAYKTFLTAAGVGGNYPVKPGGGGMGNDPGGGTGAGQGQPPSEGTNPGLNINPIQGITDFFNKITSPGVIHAIIGGLVIGGGIIVMGAGVLLLAGKSVPLPGVAGALSGIGGKSGHINVKTGAKSD